MQAVRRSILWVALAAPLVGTGCRASRPDRAAPGPPPAPAGALAPTRSGAPDAPPARPPRDLGTIRASASDDDEEDDDEEEEGGGPAVPGGPAGAPSPGPGGGGPAGPGHPSRSPVSNREGPFDETDGEARKAEPEEPEDLFRNADGYPQPDLLMKALGADGARTRLYGWVEAGELFNPARPWNHENLPNTPSDLADVFQMQQLYLVVERTLRNTGEVDFGYRVDNLFGTDWELFRANGLLDHAAFAHGYGDSPNQFYVDLHLPVLTAGGLDVRVGRFLSLAGYESAFAPGRPLRSTGYLFNYSHPFTHVGVLTTLNVTDRFQVFNAPVNGWDRWLGRQDRWGYMGGINWDSEDEATNLTLAYYAGPSQITYPPPARSAGPAAGPPVASPTPGGRGARGGPTALVSAVLSHQWLERWTSVFETDYGADRLPPRGPFGPRDSAWYGASTWLLYEPSPRWTGVVRAGAFRDDGGIRTGYNDTYLEAVAGLVYKPKPWLWIRPEIDYNGALGTAPFHTRTGSTNNQVYFGFDILILY